MICLTMEEGEGAGGSVTHTHTHWIIIICIINEHSAGIFAGKLYKENEFDSCLSDLRVLRIFRLHYL